MRRAIYDRAREAMLTHLRGLHPRMPESDITREEIALNQAIALVEAKFDATEADPATPTPPSRRRPPRGIPIGSKRVRLQGPRSWANLPI
jgi:hypothetical protein